MGFRCYRRIGCQYHLLDYFYFIRVIANQLKDAPRHACGNRLVFTELSDVAGVVKIRSSNQQFSIVFGNLLSQRNPVGGGNDASVGMKRMIGIVVFNAVGQFISE